MCITQWAIWGLGGRLSLFFGVLFRERPGICSVGMSPGVPLQFYRVDFWSLLLLTISLALSGSQGPPFQVLWLESQGFGTSLMTQWLRICLPMQGTRVRALVQEGPTCRGATKPVRHNY